MTDSEFAFPGNNLLVGNSSKDDAAVYDLGDGKALISTTDFFMPIVDDAFDFGRIASANALSDVYAMGGKPINALNVCCFPQEGIEDSILAEILRGGLSKIQEDKLFLKHLNYPAQPHYF